MHDWLGAHALEMHCEEEADGYFTPKYTSVLRIAAVMDGWIVVFEWKAARQPVWTASAHNVDVSVIDLHSSGPLYRCVTVTSFDF